MNDRISIQKNDMMNVIYIDDDASNRAVLREMFAVGKLPLAEAADAGTGLKMLGENSYNLVLLDLRMPGMNGLTAIRQVRARTGAAGEVPIVVVTAELTSGVRQMCRDAGATDFLCKPVIMTELFDIVASHMANSQKILIN